MRFETRLFHNDMLGNAIIVFRVEKPEGFQFQAGQFCAIALQSIGFTC